MLNDEQRGELVVLARVVGASPPYQKGFAQQDLTAYVESLLAAERERVIEECAKVCEETYPESIGNNIVQLPQFPNDGLHCAAAIRALKGK